MGTGRALAQLCDPPDQYRIWGVVTRSTVSGAAAAASAIKEDVSDSDMYEDDDEDDLEDEDEAEMMTASDENITSQV